MLPSSTKLVLVVFFTFKVLTFGRVIWSSCPLEGTVDVYSSISDLHTYNTDQSVRLHACTDKRITAVVGSECSLFQVPSNQVHNHSSSSQFKHLAKTSYKFDFKHPCVFVHTKRWILSLSKSHYLPQGSPAITQTDIFVPDWPRGRRHHWPEHVGVGLCCLFCCCNCYNHCGCERHLNASHVGVNTPRLSCNTKP